MIPTLGRIVHYTNLGDAEGEYPSEQQAAIITSVKLLNEFPEDYIVPVDEENRFSVTLHIFYKTGQFDMEAPYSPEYKRGHWTWPPKVS